MIDLKDKKILITGGSRGLGRSFVYHFTKLGAQVAFTYSKDDMSAEVTKKTASEYGTEPIVFKGDVSDATHAKSVVKELVEKWGQIDALVNNAAVNQFLPIALLDEEEWDEVMSVNVKGTYLFTRNVLKHMIKKKEGHILNLGSFASEKLIESPVHYATSKSAIRGFTESLAVEVGRHNIKVNLLSPGLLDEGLSKIIPQHRLEEYLEQSALGRVGESAELASLAAFLISPDNSFMTGTKIVADGGL